MEVGVEYRVSIGKTQREFGVEGTRDGSARKWTRVEMAGSTHSRHLKDRGIKGQTGYEDNGKRIAKDLKDKLGQY